MDAPSDTPERARPVVLYVDDERGNRLVFWHVLSDEFEVVLAESGPEALEVLEQRPVSVLLADHRMPGMSGVELAARARARHPELPRLVISAWPDDPAIVEAQRNGDIHFLLTKPWDRESVVRALWAALGAHRLPPR
jgi:response regulator RpfG family c-di-GMP phosphodiesterase